MPDQISWMFKANVTGGPSISADGLLPIEAYDKVEVSVAAKKDSGPDGCVDLAVLPAAAVLFLMISASDYPADTLLTYTIGNQGATSYTLDGPLVLIGSGAVKLLGEDQSKFTFYNPGPNPVTVSILVGRKASAAA